MSDDLDDDALLRADRADLSLEQLSRRVHIRKNATRPNTRRRRGQAAQVAGATRPLALAAVGAKAIIRRPAHPKSRDC